MAFFPRIQSPCPYKGNLAAVMDGDQCRVCQRRVFDLTALTDGERRAFLAGCGDEVCVSYSLRPAIAAAVLAAAAALPAPALAQEVAAPVADVPAATADYTEADYAGADALEEWIFVGGIKDPSNVEYIDTAEDAAIPELPVVYEDSPADQASPVSPSGGS
jgi:hypothetical protein